MSALSTGRVQALSVFKQLLRTRQQVFRGDQNALQAARDKIKTEFLKHKAETDPGKIDELIKVAKESEELLRTKVIQAQEVKPHVFRIRKDHFTERCVTAKRERCADCTCGA
ncbi:Complex III assembly factor LYRM7 [Orchesella cincta]|uniref:Complex III assembly factor LYRM7 n=1 Tax=Orchesella cincta TaxID=48709 RepID=A0A1D2N7B3_ORCCI|nr:Complex III assembly factor LYRM7 [Orchesella cincta]